MVARPPLARRGNDPVRSDSRRPPTLETTHGRPDAVLADLPAAAEDLPVAVVLRVAAVVLALLPGRSGRAPVAARDPAGSQRARGRAVRRRGRSVRARLARPAALHRPGPDIPRIDERNRVQHLRLPEGARTGRPEDHARRLPARIRADEDDRRLPAPRAVRRPGRG